MKLSRIVFFLILLPFSSSVLGQTVNTADSIDIVVRKMMKKKREKLTDMIDDSTGRTYEYSRKSGVVILACLKSIRDRITTELHFNYDNGSLLRVSCSIWDRKNMKATFDYYYFRNNIFLFTNPPDNPDPVFITYLLETSTTLYDRAKAFHSTKK